jgi:LEA14-like dessication related protein
MSTTIKRRQLLALSGSGIFLSACSGLGGGISQQLAPKVSVTSVNLKKLTLQQVSIDVGLNVFNPNTISIPLRGIDYALAVNNQQVASGQQNQSVTIAAKQSSNVTIPISVNLIQFASLIPSIASGGGFKYNLTGKMHFPFISLPFNRSGGLQI